MKTFSNYKYILLFFCVLAFNMQTVFSQNVDSTLNDLLNKYNIEENDFQNINQSKINNDINATDVDFSKNLQQNWNQVYLNSSQQPSVFPEVEQNILENDIIEIGNSTIEYKIINADYKFKKNTFVPVKFYVDDNYVTNYKTVDLDFYETNLSINYDVAISNFKSDEIGTNSISIFWDAAASTNYSEIIYQLLNYKTNLNLPDWGYLMMVQQFSEQISENQNNANLLTWFLMLKSGYKIKLAYNQTNYYCLIGSSNTIYGLQFYDIDGIRYYIRESNVENLQTYNDNYSESNFYVNLNIDKSINLYENLVQKEFIFSYNDTKYKMTVDHNQNIIDFYNDYPMSDIKTYFDAAVSPSTKESLQKNFTEYLDGKTEYEAVSFLLEFVQTAFAYKNDIEQFNQEKYYFPEEMFAYNFSDCEDRAVLFAYLVKELTNLKVIGLNLQTHITTAVKFDEEIVGDNVLYNNEKYIICDPTFINAPVGYVNPKYLKNEIELIDLENKQYFSKKNTEIWGRMQEIGIFPYDNNQNLVFDNDGNYYIIGFYIDNINFGGNLLNGEPNKADLIVAKFNSDNKIIWYNDLETANEAYGISINFDNQNNCFISGLISKLNNGYTENNNLSQTFDVFISMYNSVGQPIWRNFLGIDTVSFENGFVYTSKLSFNGELISTLVLDNPEYFSNYGIEIYENNIQVTGIINNFNLQSSDDFVIGETRSITNTSATILNNWENDKNSFLELNYNNSVAGLFAFMKAIKSSGNSVTGSQAVKIITENDSNLKKSAPELYLSINNIDNLSNTEGVITFKTKNSNQISLNDIVIENNAKISVSTFKGGNTKINVISGIYFNNNQINYKLNYLKIIVLTGEVIIDYDTDHSMETQNIDSDFLKK